MRERHVRLGRWELSWWREETRWGEAGEQVQVDTWFHLRRHRRRR